MCSYLDIVEGGGASSGYVSVIGLRGIFSLVDWTPFLDWTIFPFIVSSADGKYAVELSRVSPGQVR